MSAISGARRRFGRLPVSSDPVRADEPIEGARRQSGGDSYEILIVVDDAASLESLELAYALVDERTMPPMHPVEHADAQHRGVPVCHGATLNAHEVNTAR